MTIDGATESRGISWERILGDPIEREGHSLLDTIKVQLQDMISQAKELNPEVAVDHNAEQLVLTVIAEVVSDMVVACDIHELTSIFPMKDTEHHDLAFALNADDQFHLGINEQFLFKLIKMQQDSGDQGAVTNQEMVQIIFMFAHEIVHFRQYQHLPHLHKEDDLLPQSSLNPRDYVVAMREKLMSQSSPITSLSISDEYELNIVEIHANALATRYIATKRQDFNATQFWQDLDITPFLENKWSSFASALQRKKLSQRIRLGL